MVTFIEIVSGPLEGSRYKVEAGTQVGRTTGRIIINDPKVSSLHAQVELDAKGQLMLVDLDSSNGLYISGRRVRKIALLSGVTFEVGRTLCKVVQVQEEDAQDFGRVVTWREILKDSFSDSKSRNETHIDAGKIFLPLLRLTFLQGIQTGEVLTLAYGPRLFGANTLDMELMDPESPALAFEIHPLEAGAMIKNLSDRFVRLNNKPVQKETLSEGDIIMVGNSALKVTYG